MCDLSKEKLSVYQKSLELPILLSYGRGVPRVDFGRVLLGRFKPPGRVNRRRGAAIGDLATKVPKMTSGSMSASASTDKPRSRARCSMFYDVPVNSRTQSIPLNSGSLTTWSITSKCLRLISANGDAPRLQCIQCGVMPLSTFAPSSAVARRRE